MSNVYVKDWHFCLLNLVCHLGFLLIMGVGWKWVSERVLVLGDGILKSLIFVIDFEIYVNLQTSN
jgi:hypothetical protein